MPLMVKIGPNPNWKPAKDDAAQAETFKAIKAKGIFETDYVNAMECVSNSRGMYAIVAADPKPVAEGPRALEDMTNDELKQMMLVAGITPQKQMKRGEVIKAIRLKLDAVEIADDEDGE